MSNTSLYGGAIEAIAESIIAGAPNAQWRAAGETMKYIGAAAAAEGTGVDDVNSDNSIGYDIGQAAANIAGSLVFPEIAAAAIMSFEGGIIAAAAIGALVSVSPALGIIAVAGLAFGAGYVGGEIGGAAFDAAAAAYGWLTDPNGPFGPNGFLANLANDTGTWILHILDNIHIAQLLPIDPLVLDLNGDGVALTSLVDGARFDFGGDLFKEKTGWVDAHDGILVVDDNGNGLIDDGSEMFGNFRAFGAAGGTQTYGAAPGFAQLASYDSNGDGKVDASDAKFSEIKVWQDANQNGKTDAGELKGLATLGIASLNVASAVRISIPYGCRQFEFLVPRNSLTLQRAA